MDFGRLRYKQEVDAYVVRVREHYKPRRKMKRGGTLSPKGKAAVAARAPARPDAARFCGA